MDKQVISPLLISVVLVLSELAFASSTCDLLFKPIQVFDPLKISQSVTTPTPEKSELNWPFRLNDFFTRRSPDGKYVLKYDEFGNSTLFFEGRVLRSNLHLGNGTYGFSEDSKVFYFVDTIENSKQSLARLNLETNRFMDPLVIPRSHVFIRALANGNILVRRINASFSVIDGVQYQPGDFAILREKAFWGFRRNHLMYLESPKAPRNGPRAVEIVAVNKSATFAVLVRTYDSPGSRRGLGRFWSQFEFEVYRLDDGRLVSSSDQLSKAEWQFHTSITGIDRIAFDQDRLVLSGFERQTAHTIVDLRSGSITLVDAEKSAKFNLPTIAFNGTTFLAQINLSSGSLQTKSTFSGFNDFGWGLQEKFQYSFLRNGEVLVISKDENFVAGFDLLNSRSLSYDELVAIPGGEETIFYQMNRTTERFYR